MIQDSDNINNSFISSSESGLQPDDETVKFQNSNTIPDISKFNFSLVDTNTIDKTLLSVGVDGIGVRMLVYCCSVILPYVAHLINYCLEKSVFPECWELQLLYQFLKQKLLRAINTLDQSVYCLF